jgi:hypothetical protein
VCVQEPCVYLLSAASVVIRNSNELSAHLLYFIFWFHIQFFEIFLLVSFV